jgi:hypothetical protein
MNSDEHGENDQPKNEILKEQEQNAKAEEGIGAKRLLLNLLWFTPAFFPALVAICTLKRTDVMPSTSFWVLNTVCSLIAGIGFWRGITNKKLLNGLAGFGTGGMLFVLNFVATAIVIAGLMVFNSAVAFFQGCCSGH